MGSKQIAALKPDGRMDAMRFYPHSLHSPRSDPKHPDYADGLASAQGKAPPEWAAKYHESGDAARKAAKS